MDMLYLKTIATEANMVLFKTRGKVFEQASAYIHYRLACKISIIRQSLINFKVIGTTIFWKICFNIGVLSPNAINFNIIWLYWQFTLVTTIMDTLRKLYRFDLVPTCNIILAVGLQLFRFPTQMEEFFNPYSLIKVNLVTSPLWRNAAISFGWSIIVKPQEVVALLMEEDNDRSM